jgi:hypothetical protein
MSRTINASTLAALNADNLRYIYLVDIQLDGGDLSFNTSLTNYTYNSKSFIGTGNLGQVGSIKESSNLDPDRCQITLSGIDTVLLAAILAENYVNRPAFVYIALLDDSNQIIGEPFVHFPGVVGALAVSYGSTAVINIELNDSLVLWARPKIKRYTNQQQQSKHPGDKGLEFVEQIADKDVIWPTAEYLRILG